MSEEVEETYDPFGKDAAQASLIVQMKIYDVLMALLRDSDPDTARELDKLHTNGVILGMGPNFSQFVPRADTVPRPVDDSEE